MSDLQNEVWYNKRNRCFGFLPVQFRLRWLNAERNIRHTWPAQEEPASYILIHVRFSSCPPAINNQSCNTHKQECKQYRRYWGCNERQVIRHLQRLPALKDIQQHILLPIPDNSVIRHNETGNQECDTLKNLHLIHYYCVGLNHTPYVIDSNIRGQSVNWRSRSTPDKRNKKSAAIFVRRYGISRLSNSHRHCRRQLIRTGAARKNCLFSPYF